MSWLDNVMQHSGWLKYVTLCNEIHLYWSVGESYCLHIHEIPCNRPINQSTNQPTNQPTNQTNKQTNRQIKKKQINCRGDQPVQSLLIYIQFAGIHMTKVFFSNDFLPDWSCLLPVVTTKVAEHIRISPFPSYFQHYSFYILAMCFIVNKVWWLVCCVTYSSPQNIKAECPSKTLLLSIRLH